MTVTRRAPASLVLSVLLLSGCSAVTYLPAPAAEDEALLASHGACGSCAVTGFADTPGEARFAARLAETGLFSSVVATTTSAIPAGTDWEIREFTVWRWDPGRRGCPDTMWLATMFSFGVIPSVRSEHVSRRFLVFRLAAGEESRVVDVGGEVTGVAGCLATPLLALPWWWTTPDSGLRAGREAELLAVELVRRGILDGCGPVP